VWQDVARMIRSEVAAAPAPGPLRLLQRWLYHHPRVQLLLLLSLPLGALLIVYFGSLAVLLANAFWTLDPFTRQVQHVPSLDSFATILGSAVYRTITLRTIGLAFLVTVTCAVIGFPVAYYIARIATPRTRRLLVVGILLPLWASYLVKVFAWRAILQQQGVLNWLLDPFGLQGPGYGDVATWLVFTYLWLPYMILPIVAGLERIPSSLLEASSDLGGRAAFTFRKVVLPLSLPAVVAGSIFTFSLTMGDFITPQLVSSTQFLGNVIYREVGVSGNLPLAAALALIPVVVMVVYLVIARRLGAFEAL
jgi:putative spermidine/putrescine transport system permease protein